MDAVYAHWHYLQVLVEDNADIVKAILKKSHSQVVPVLCHIVFAFVEQNHLFVNDQLRNKLIRYRKQIELLSDERQSDKIKRKTLERVGHVILKPILIAVLPHLLSPKVPYGASCRTTRAHNAKRVRRPKPQKPKAEGPPTPTATPPEPIDVDAGPDQEHQQQQPEPIVIDNDAATATTEDVQHNRSFGGESEQQQQSDEESIGSTDRSSTSERSEQDEDLN